MYRLDVRLALCVLLWGSAAHAAAQAKVDVCHYDGDGDS